MRENSFRANTWSAWIFAACFLVVYNIGLLRSTDNAGTQTVGMFRLFSVLFVIVLLVVFGIVKTLFKRRGRTTNTFKGGLILYILSELIFFCFAGEFSLFGIFYQLKIYTVNYAPDLVPFRESRDMIFSCSSLIAAVVSFFKPKLG